MGFKRVWDESCPREWDWWEADDARWVIRDLRPEDDELAVAMLRDHLCTDETLCSLSNLMSDPVSVRSITDFWRYYIAQRMSLGCYEERDGQSKLVGVNVCAVICQGEEHEDIVEGKAWKNVYGALKVCDDKVDAFKLLALDKLLYAVGLVVRRDYRGARLGPRILAAREPLALHHGVLGTSTVFTSPRGQVSAERAGFSSALTVTLRELADAGLHYPRDSSHAVKLMVKKYDRPLLPLHQHQHEE